MRTTTPHIISRSVAAALVAAAVTAPAAVAQQDLRMPDTRDAAERSQQRQRQDLRMPDTRDAAEGRGPQTAPIVEVVEVPQPQAEPVAQGFDWGDAGLGALAGAGVLLLAAGGSVATVRLRRRPIGSSA
jgi:hypothetical protein